MKTEVKEKMAMKETKRACEKGGKENSVMTREEIFKFKYLCTLCGNIQLVSCFQSFWGQVAMFKKKKAPHFLLLHYVFLCMRTSLQQAQM